MEEPETDLEAADVGATVFAMRTASSAVATSSATNTGVGVIAMVGSSNEFVDGRDSVLLAVLVQFGQHPATGPRLREVDGAHCHCARPREQVLDDVAPVRDTAAPHDREIGQAVATSQTQRMAIGLIALPE